jgi:hypothetical protein
MNWIKLNRLNEWYPGARSIEESIEYFIQRGEELGISIDDIKAAIDVLIQYRETGETQDVDQDTFRAVRYFETAIDTMIDDGWPEEWIYRELEKLVE